jgi:hypothetical protein
MKLLMEPVGVETQGGQPAVVVWRRRRYPVREVAQSWTWRGRWWTDPDLEGEHRLYFRLLCDGVRMEIFEHDDNWTLSRLLD